MFENFSDRELARIDALTCETVVAAGRTLMSQGRPGSEAVIVLSGYADVAVDGEVVSHIGTGDIVGELALLDGEPRSATVTAATDMQVLIPDRGQFALLLREPRAVLAIAACLARRVHDAEHQLWTCQSALTA